jgi:7-carboxy-7-deazaguanine synthase
MVINEIFYSIQGEGLLAGVPSVFIRLAGCPVRCKWCDTKYAWDPNAGEDLTIPQIIRKVEDVAAGSSNEQRATSHGCRYTVITGGEPMTNEQLPELAKALKEQDKHITIETAGIAYIPDLACDLMSISPKLSNCGAKTVPDTFFFVKQLIEHYPYQLKFVVESAEDLPEIQQVVESLGDVSLTRVTLMPQAKTRDELIARSPIVAKMCEKTGYTFCNRLQLLLYNGAKGK